MPVRTPWIGDEIAYIVYDNDVGIEYKSIIVGISQFQNEIYLHLKNKDELIYGKDEFRYVKER